MRILETTHYMPPHPGGIERVAASLVEGLRQRGHEIRWIASATPERPGHDGVHVRVPALNLLEERFGVPYPVWSPGAAASLADEVQWAEVVHVHDCLYLGSALAAALCRRHRRPLLLTQHVGYVPFGRLLDLVQRTAYQTLGRAVLAAADRRIACSAHVPAYFASLGFHGRFDVVPNAIDEARFRVPTEDERRDSRRAWGVDPGARVLLFVGRLVPKKAVARVVEAQRALASEGTTLVVVGDGPLVDQVRGAPGTVHHPSVEPARMPELYALADVFALPSRGEGLPLSVQEAMMTGLPAVVSDDPSYVANLADAPGVQMTADDAALVQGLRAALASPPARAEVAGWARSRWGGARFLDSYEQALQELAAAAGR